MVQRILAKKAYESVKKGVKAARDWEKAEMKAWDDAGKRVTKQINEQRKRKQDKVIDSVKRYKNPENK